MIKPNTNTEDFDIFDIERKDAQKEKRKKQNMNMLHYRDILQKQYRKKNLYSMLGQNGQDVPKSI